MRTRLRVLVALDQPAVAARVAGVLRRRGHHVLEVSSGEQALSLPPPDALVSDWALPDLSGLELHDTLRRRGASMRTVFVSERPSLSDCRRALQLGAAEYLTVPFAMDELVRAVEGVEPPPALPRDDADWALRRETAAVPSQVDRLVRDVLAFLVRAGVGPSTRARVAGACAEVLENVCRHAYVERPGRLWLEAELGGRDLAVTISDEGLGLDPVAVRVAAQHHSGLDRAAALSESLELNAEPGRGTSVTLTFSVYRVDFDEDPAVDLSELDYLTPALARRVTETLCGPDRGAALHLSPALAVTIGRLLAASTADRGAHEALWR